MFGFSMKNDEHVQLEIPWRDAATLRVELEGHTELPIEVAVTDNTSRLMSIRRRRKDGPVQVRVHHMFLSAPPRIVRALAAWIQSPRAKRADGLLNEFIREHAHLVREDSVRAIRTVTQGRCFDIQALFNAINQEEFGNVVNAAITWGRMPASRRRRSIRFGSYYPREHLIRIHPSLDQPFIPLYFIRYIVFHEMLHAFLGTESTANGRRRIHTAEFNRRETAFADYGRAEAWQNQPGNLKKLLSFRG